MSVCRVTVKFKWTVPVPVPQSQQRLQIQDLPLATEEPRRKKRKSALMELIGNKFQSENEQTQLLRT